MCSSRSSSRCFTFDKVEEERLVSFEMQEWTRRGNDVIRRTRETLEQAPSDDVRALTRRLPDSITPDNQAVKVVFAGQYSAGKSTIVRLLTGRDDIEVGAGITTQTAHPYDWNGVQVIDTPGVHSELRPDHDEITYQAISNADLIVFVVTNELFDAHVAEHFRALAINRDKGHEMILVVNKMQRCEGGNAPEQQAYLREDLRKVIAPFTPEQLRITFIDAESEERARKQKDAGLVAALRRKSGFETFVDQLNRFVREKGIAAKSTTALYTVEQILSEALAKESSGDVDVDALEELLLQQRRAFLETQLRMPIDFRSAVQQKASEVRRRGRDVSDLIHGHPKPSKINEALEEAQAWVESMVEVLTGELEGVATEHLRSLQERLDEVSGSELARTLLPRLAARVEVAMNELDIDSGLANIVTQGANLSADLGKFLVNSGFKATATSFSEAMKLGQYSGTNLHNAVKEIGSFIGYKFKPWEAVRLTKNLVNIGRGLAVVGTVLSFAMQIKADEDAKQLERDLRENRLAVRTSFNETASVVEMHFDEATQSYVATTITPALRDIDAQLAALRSMQKNRSEVFDSLTTLLTETNQLIREIHMSA